MILGRGAPSVTFTLEVIPTQHLPVIASHRLTHTLYSNFECQASSSQWERGAGLTLMTGNREIAKATESKRFYMVGLRHA
jgi:hypothetical protein